MRNIFLILLIFKLQLFNSQFSHNKLNDLLPPSPNSNSLIRFGNLNAGLHTGSTDFKINIINFNNSLKNIPIDLTYISNGIKVNQYESSVGLGWNLLAGGVITRSTRGLPDYTSVNLQKSIPEEQIDYDVTNNKISHSTLKFIDNSLYQDKEYDKFYFNFFNYSGCFIIDDNERVYLISNNEYNLKIDFKSNIDIAEFIITDEQGVEYKFSIQEKTKYQNLDFHYYFASSWLLDEVSYMGKKIEFKYLPYPYHIPYIEEQFLKSLNTGLCNSDKCHDEYSIIEKYSEHLAYLIDEISTNNSTDGYIKFKYKNIYRESIGNLIKESDAIIIDGIEYIDRTNKLIDKIDFDYNINNNKRIFLKSIKKKTLGKYSFEYYNDDIFPNRLSFSIDHYGYFNGEVNNMSLLPQQDIVNFSKSLEANREINTNYTNIGLLKKIAYPSAGNTVIEYENNKIFGFSIPQIETFSNIGGNFYFTTSEEYISYRNYTTEIQLNKLIKLTSSEEQLNLEFSPYVLIIERLNDVTGTTTEIYRENISSNFYSFNISLDKNCKYLFKTLDYQNSPVVDITIKIKFATLSNEKQNILSGGCRVKKITDTDGRTKTYKYVEDLNSLKSSGKSSFVPNKYSYISNFERAIVCDNSGDRLPSFIFNHCLYSKLSANIYDYFFGPLNFETFYSKVFVSHGNNFEFGGEEVDFFIEKYTNQNILYTENSFSSKMILLQNDLKNITGKIKEKKTFNQKFEISEVIRYKYSYNKEFEHKIYNYFSEQLFDMGINRTFFYKCSLNELGIKFTTNYCVASHSHNYKYLNNSFVCVSMDNNNIIKEIGHDCYKRAPEEVLIYEKRNQNINIIRYFDLSEKFYLSQVTREIFRENKILAQKNIYNYNDLNNSKPTSQTTIFPDNSVQETSYQYAHEKGNQYLIDKNMVGIPLQTTVTKTANGVTKTLSDVETKYPTSQTEADSKTTGLALPYEVWSKDFQGNTSKEVLYKNYDDKGNLREYIIKPDTNGNGTPVTLIWGYNNTQPIAKIEGATYGQVQNEITDIVLASEKDNNPAAYSMSSDEAEINLRNKLDEFRKKTNLSNYQITTYSYDPLIGVTSITPPSGIREIYQYDSANRLEKIVDVNGKLLKEFKYNYKN